MMLMAPSITMVVTAQIRDHFCPRVCVRCVSVARATATVDEGVWIPIAASVLIERAAGAQKIALTGANHVGSRRLG